MGGKDEDRWTRPVLALIVLVPMAFNAVMLWPQLLPAVYGNDAAWHYTFIRAASAALANGDNPFDFWMPDTGLGFPQFFYYQHVPHLAVVLLHALLLKRVNLLMLFNLVQYVLLVVFPLTVYWSLRTMEFSMGAAAVAAAFAPLISEPRFFMGLDFHSYTFIGFGMYTQLWAMHLYFLTTACLQRLMARGSGYLSAIVFSSLLVLSHLLYAYMAAFSAFVLFLINLKKESTPA
ncbi:MAG TPA: hypothetical protein VIX59_15960 [Candidatus Binataceae bacterium]